MKVGDLVMFKNTIGVRGKVYLILRIEEVPGRFMGKKQKVWLYPDPYGYEIYSHTVENYYYEHVFVVVSESR